MEMHKKLQASSQILVIPHNPSKPNEFAVINSKLLVGFCFIKK
jgi:hypothetical protein